MTDLIREVMLCAALVGEPPSCIGPGHPAAQLTNAPCAMPEISSVSPGWRAGVWRGQAICWRYDGARVRIIAGNQPVQYLDINREQAQCLRVYCTPEQSTQTGSHPGKKGSK